MNLKFDQRTAVVTGGTGALGSVVAERFLSAGANVVLPYRSEQSLRNLPHKVLASKENVLLVKADLVSESEVDGLFAQSVAKFGSVDFVANTAGGYAGGKEISDVSLEEWESILKLNLLTTFLVCKAALRLMRPRGSGRLVNITAMPALNPVVKKGPYAVSKRAVITLTETIAAEVKGTGITANAIAPSIILTKANRDSMPDADVAKWVPPEHIAELILFLCSDAAASINGNTIKTYGGT